MSKKHRKCQGNARRDRPQRLNTGLSDALSGFSFKPLPTSQQWAKSESAAPTDAARSDDGRYRNLEPKPSRHRHDGIADINTGLADAFEKMAGTPIPDRPGPPARQHSRPSVQPTPRPAQHAQPGVRSRGLPSHMLKPLSQLPDWENTKNFVFVKVGGSQYTYPIHSWLPVLDLCEAIHQGCADRLIIREQSRKAIAEIIQSYCDRGPFGLIARSLVERTVRKHLGEKFTTQPTGPTNRTRRQVRRGEGAPTTPVPAVPQPSYEERMRAYRARNPHDAEKASAPVRDRLAEYIAAKAKRIGEGPERTLDGAFTQKTEGARTVWVGLDFGTQNLKIAFRDGETDDQSVILELNPEGHGIDRYLIAPVTVVEGSRLVHKTGAGKGSPSWKHALSVYYGDSYVAEDHAIRSWLQNSSEVCKELQNRSADEQVRFFTATHLAFLLETVGRTVRAYYRDQGITDVLAFRVFMCAPVSALDQQLSQSIFQDCLTIADEMHAVADFSTGRIDVDDALKAYDQASRLGILLEPRPCRRSRVVPEVLAEIASFAQSRSAREGVYALVDIGAGTLDLNVFKILGATADKGVRTPVYAATCHPNGVNHLEALLAAAMDGSSGAAGRHFQEQKLRRCFPDVDALACACGQADNQDSCRRLGKAHRAYCDDVAQRTRLTWGQAWEKRGLEREEWARLTLFLCGGGASIRDIRGRLEAGMPDQIISRISHSVLPCPSEEEFVRPAGFPEEDFHRVAVAYGLTFGSDFEPYMLPSQVHKVRIHRETFDVASQYISKDMV